MDKFSISFIEFINGSIPIVQIKGVSVLTVTSGYLSYVFEVLTKPPNCIDALSKNHYNFISYNEYYFLYILYIPKFHFKPVVDI